jgi:hypothetical protein
MIAVLIRANDTRLQAVLADDLGVVVARATCFSANVDPIGSRFPLLVRQDEMLAVAVGARRAVADAGSECTAVD